MGLVTTENQALRKFSHHLWKRRGESLKRKPPQKPLSKCMARVGRNREIRFDPQSQFPCILRILHDKILAGNEFSCSALRIVVHKNYPRHLLLEVPASLCPILSTTA